MTEVQSLKIVNRYDSDVVLHDSKDYPEFSGELWNDFVLFLVNKSANLYGANLVRANLYGANLVRANLVRANLVRANLYGANLYGANLYGANLESANLPLFSKWSIRYELPDTVHIGCKTKTIKEWDYWFKNSTEKFDHDRDSSTFKRIYANYLGVRAYLKECQKQKLFKKEVDENNNIKWFAE